MVVFQPKDGNHTYLKTSNIHFYFVFFDSCFGCFSFWISIPEDPGRGPCFANLNKSPTTD